jgi:4-diphosphocytidyl-2-C-methyl-D-erythritol kinase
VYPLEHLPRYWVVLVIPPFGVATKDAYEWFDEGGKRDREGFSRPIFPGHTTPLVNDLEAPVAARHPVITQLKQRFTERGALLAAMSGSGSTVFGIFKSAAAAQRAARAFRNEGVQVLTARFLSRRRPQTCP